MKKTTVLLLLLSLIAACASGCAGGQKSPSSTSAASGTTAAVSGGTAKTAYKDNLPSLDFGGETFTVLTRDPSSASWINPQIDVETQTGEVLNDAIYGRDRTVEERFNFKFKQILDATDYSAATRSSILAGDDVYDLVLITDRTGLTFAQEGLIYSVKDLKYVDLDQPYWSKTLNASLSIHNKQYFAYGDYNLTTYDYTHVLVFNKQMAENYSVGDLYDIIGKGGWTYEKYAAAAVACVKDLDGDGAMTEKDSYGFLSQPKHVLPCFWVAAGVQSITKDSGDEPSFKLTSDVKFASVIDKIFTMTWDNKSWFVNTAANNASLTLNDMFENNQGLFLDTTFFYISALRNMENDFGIIPYPKYDEKQSSYYSRVEGGMVPMVPVTNADPETAGAVLEALSCESANTVIPAYYDIALKSKYARDAESVKMLDLIFDGRIYDLGDTYWCDQLRDGIFLKMFGGNNRDYASSMASVEATVNAQIKKSVDAFDAIG